MDAIVSTNDSINDDDASLNRLMCGISSEVIAVADSSKFNYRWVQVICPWSKITRLATDSDIANEYADALGAAGIKLCILDA